jgi:hypothetical protein
MQANQSKTCPSALGQVGSNIVGVVNPSGTIGYFADPIEVTQEFLDSAGDPENLERKFRFSNKCVKSGCSQWTGQECGVIKAVMAMENIPAHDTLPVCSVRSSCRWYYQEGFAACNGCRYVITNVSELAPEAQVYMDV